MSAKGGAWGTTWDLVLGDPTNGKLAADALMQESQKPRTGSDPLLSAPLAPPSATSPSANPVNGHEWNALNSSIGDLQYACIFPLTTPIACDADGANCECGEATDDYENPLCQAADGTYGQMQLRAKAYPGVRELEVLQGLGSQGIVASICPENFDTQAPDYGYDPAVGAIVERLKKRLATACLPLHADAAAGRQLPVHRHRGAPGRSDRPALDRRSVQVRRAGPRAGEGRRTAARPEEAEAQGAAVGEKYACYCEIDQLLGAERDVCQTDTGHAPVLDGKSVDGWCYVDPVTGQGSEKIVKDCPADARRELRFVNGGNPEPKTTTYITCTD